MRGIFNKLIQTNTSTVFLLLYGLIIQLAALPAIHIYSLVYKDLMPASLYEILVLIWFCVPIISVFAVVIAAVQIRVRRINGEKFRAPLIGLLLNSIWIAGYAVILYLIFAVGILG
jgi:hypothetical protein